MWSRAQGLSDEQLVDFDIAVNAHLSLIHIEISKVLSERSRQR